MATIQPPQPLVFRSAVPAQDRSMRLPLLLAVVLFYLMLIPEQANFRLFDVLLSPYRIFLIFGLLFLVSATSREKFRFAIPDLAIILACFWIALASFMVTGSLTDTIVQGGAYATDIGLAYFFMRMAIRTPRDLRFFMILIAPGVGLVGLMVFLESISGRLIVQPLFSAITGQPNRVDVEMRLGLVRGVASFPHPILAGISLASFLTLFWMSGLRGWPRMMGAIAAFASFFTMSSAALLGLVAGTILMAYDWLSLRFRNFTWSLFLLGSSILYATIELSTNSGFFNLLVRYASLNTVSAYNRVLIWQYGSESVLKHPFFGIGYEDWERPSWMNWSTSSSVDHFWLIMAMRFGLPASLLLIFATGIAILLVAKRSASMSDADARLMRGVTIALVVFALGAVSVALWLNALVWFFMLVGVAVSLASTPQNRKVFLRRAIDDAKLQEVSPT